MFLKPTDPRFTAWHVQMMRRRRLARSIWTPAALFSAGQQGVWYEPKPEYLYQDSAGTTPVTGDGQPVGLMLDRHLGLTLGENLLPIIDGALNGWTADNGAVIEITDSVVKITNGQELASRIYYTASTEAGKGYWFDVDILEDSSSSARISINDGANPSFNGSLYAASVTQSGNFRAYFTAASTSSTVAVFVNSSTVGASISIKEPMARELPGNHAPQSTASYKPLYAITPDQLDFDAFDDVLPVTFPVDMGADVTIGRAVPGVGGEILTGQTVGTSYDITQDMAALIIVNETPSADNLSKLQAYLDTMAGV